MIFTYLLVPGRLAQSVTTDACLTADQGVSEFDPGPVRYCSEDWSWNKLISMVILHHSVDFFQEGFDGVERAGCFA